jgi:hypothetical protein
MPFAVNDILQYKRNERQRREIHEREYSKYILNLRQQSPHSNLPYISNEYMKEIERARLRNHLNRQNQYERIQRENDLLSKRLFQTNQRTMIDNQNFKYQQNLNVLNFKYFQQRLNEYKRIQNENHLLLKRINNVRGQLINKQQCEQDWQRQINWMKKKCNYPENIDRFVSNNKANQQRKGCKWNHRSQSTDKLFTLILGLSE